MHHKPSPLHEYAAGKITWRQAAAALGIFGFADFEVALKEAGLSLYEPSPEQSAKKMAALDAWLDEGT